MRSQTSASTQAAWLCTIYKGTLIDHQIESIKRSPELQEMVSATMPTGPTAMDLVGRVRMGLTPSFNLAASGQATQSPGPASEVPVRSDGTALLDCEATSILPRHVIHALINRYVQRLLPRAPFIAEDVLWKQAENVMATLDPHSDESTSKSSRRIKPSYDHLVVCTVLAISATLGCSYSAHESRCMAFSEILFNEGIQHMRNEAIFPDDLAAIQATLLILQYAEINPKCANIWVLGGAAMRYCLDLGLHREPMPEPLEERTAASLNLRRSIFWMAYCMDRAICSALQRPLSIPDPAITTGYPVLGLEKLGSSDMADGAKDSIPPSARKSVAFHQILYWRIQSTIMEAQARGLSLDGHQEDEEWFASVERSLRQWYEDCWPIDAAQAEFGLVHGLVSLYRPRATSTSTRSTAHVHVAFANACKSTQIYRDKVLYGFVRRPWLAAHEISQSAMLALYCLRFYYESIVECYQIGELYEMMKGFTANLLHIAGQGWTEVKKLAARYERLLAPILEALLGESQTGPVKYPAEYDAELNAYFDPSSAHLDYLHFDNNSNNSTLNIGAMDVMGPDAFIWDEDLTHIFDAGDLFDWNMEASSLTMPEVEPVNHENLMMTVA
ncbi:Fungal specific transcription factor domain-containing protein [Cladophialophora immunda]|nr:Fungal specific transcription factor domain-containing protein [Cladophialophora immunda]